MTQSLITIREYKPADLHGVLDLWEYHSGWGRPEERDFIKWLSSPFGACIVFVAEHMESGIIVGQIILTPTELRIGDTQSNAIKLSAPIIHRDFRTASIMGGNSVMLQIFLDGYKIALSKGYDWIYSFPAPGWVRIMNQIHHYGLNPWKVVQFQCFELGENTVNESNYSLQILEEFPKQINEVLNAFIIRRQSQGCFTRSHEWLQYKWGDDLIVGFFNSLNHLKGYAVVKLDSGLLLDFVLPDEQQIPFVFVQLSNWVQNNTKKQSKAKNTKFKFMMNTYFQGHLNGIKSSPVDYHFTFGLSSLNARNDPFELDLHSFYLFPND